MKPFIIFLLWLSSSTNLFAQPAIGSFSPVKGAIGSSVTILGTNFNPSQSQNIVFFGATRAIVNIASANSISVTVPMGATYQYISVTDLATGLTAYSIQPFIVTLLGGTNFETKADFSMGINPYSVSIGDIDGDGKSDLAVTNSSDNTVYVLRNTSTAGFISFAQKVDFPTGTNPSTVIIGDIDGDGKPDLIVVNQNSAKISVLQNTSTTGNISFTAKKDFATGIKPASVSIGDIDGDGKPDLAIANAGSSTVSLLRNTSAPGAINFAPKVDFLTGSKPVSICIGDIDGDGKPDLAVANSKSNTISVLRNTSTAGAIGFANKIDFATGKMPYSISIGDLDGDGKQDFAVANKVSSTISVLRNASVIGSVNFTPKVDFATGLNPISVSIGDINGDGKPDLAIANNSDSTVSLLSNTSISGSISFAVQVNFATGSTPQSVSIGDLDGDGKPDVAIANFGSNTVSVLKQPCAVTSISGTNIAGQTTVIGGKFTPITVTATGTNLTFQWFKNTINTNSGGTLLSVGNGAQTNSYFPQTTTVGTSYYYCVVTGVCGLPQTSAVSGAFIVTPPPIPTVSSFAPASANVGSSITITGTNFNITAAQNIVFFGATQAMVSAATDSSLVVNVPSGATYQYISVTNLGTGLSAYSATPFDVTLAGSINFAARVDFPLGITSYIVQIGDIDGDGKSDLVLTNENDSTVSVLRNTSTPGSVSFANHIDFKTGSHPISVNIGDIDGDGRPDLTTANYWDNSISVLRNTSIPGTVSFAAKVDFSTSPLPYSVCIGDIDGDGKPDITTPNIGNATISILRNISTVGFINLESKVDYTTGTSPYVVRMGDIDGDGKPDLVTVNQRDNTVSVLLNKSISGMISIANKLDFPTDIGPFSVCIGDIDGDGKPDLAVSSYNNNTVSVLRNTSSQGTVNFDTRVNFATDAQPFSLAIGDIDGDGKPDLAVPNVNSNTASIFRNTSTVGSINFDPSLRFTTGISPISMSIGDLDGDGKPDLAETNFNGSTLSVILQQTITPLARTISVNAERQSSVVQVGFNVTTQSDISSYSIERSQDGNAFTTVGNLPADKKLGYKFTDATAPSSTLYYRIKSIDSKGKISYGNIAKVTALTNLSGFTISPNPVESNYIKVQFKNQPAGRYILRFINTIGQPVFTGILQHSGGSSSQMVNLPTGLENGTYQAELHGADGYLSTQTILIRLTK